METKPRILYLQKILLERTDEENPLSTTQLINILNDEYGISAHRTTVTKDIAALQEFGMDIVTIHSTQSKYFVASRKLELPELKLLIDAVESSKFITKKKSETLIEKIHTMTSPGQVAKLKRNNYVVNRIKPDNEQIYYIIDAINDAINASKQISFQYYDYTGLKKKVLKNKGEIYKLSPYKLLWCGDYYYVLGYSEKKSKVINFRVDRIASKPEILDKDIIPMPDDFDIENYTKEVFFMFSGEKVLVDLRCDNSLMKTMVDRFGEDVTTLAYDMTSFRVQTEVSASPTFFGWVFGFNGKVQILAPESVKEQYRQMFASVEWQADTMGASLLMPRRIIENALAKYNQSNPIRVYGDNTITSKDKAVIRRMAAYIGVSYTALVIRLRDMGLFEYHNILEYISNARFCERSI